MSVCLKAGQYQEDAATVDRDEAAAREAVLSFRDQFDRGSDADRMVLALLLSAARRLEADCRARRVARICSQRMASC